MADHTRSLRSTVVVVSMSSFVVTAGCSPLPGRSLDPVYLGSDSQPRQATASAPAVQTTRASNKTDSQGRTLWVGRYQDSRGSGEVTLDILRGDTTAAGTWKLRTGGGGPVTALAEPGSRRWRLRFENTTPECPATFEGSAEISDAVFIGTYRGKDCEGPVSDGKLDLHLR